jgi:DHA2 family multidrug resistance protein
MLQSRGASAADAAVQANGMLYGSMVRQATMLSFADTFWFMGVLFLCIIPLVFMMKKIKPARRPVMVE